MKQECSCETIVKYIKKKTDEKLYDRVQRVVSKDKDSIKDTLIQVIRLQKGPYKGGQLIVNEEGALYGLEPNLEATKIAVESGFPLRSFIVGDAVVLTNGLRVD